MSKFLNNFQSTMSMTFHGMFAIIWLLLVPGIVFWGIRSDLWILVPVLALTVVLVLYKKKSEALKNFKTWAVKYTSRYSVITVAIFLMVVQIILQMYVGYEMAVTPAGDREIIFKQASEMALSNIFKTSDEYNFYFLRYPNNQMLLVLETFWFMLLKAAGTSNFLYGNMVLNILAVDLAVILCMVLINRKYGKNAAILFQVMALLFIPFYTYIPFVYTDTLVLPIVAGILLCYQFIEEYWRKKYAVFYILLIIMGILTWFGYELKPTVAIITIACVIHMLFVKSGKRGIIGALAVIIVFGACFKAYNVVINEVNIVDQDDYDKENFPYSHWIMMGLKGTGNYNLKDREYTSSFETKEDKEKGNIQMIKKRLEDYGIKGLLVHQYIKAVSTWSNGKYDMEFHLDRQPVRNSWLQQVFFKDGKFYTLYDIYCTLYQWTLLVFIVISVIYGFIKRETGSAAMWKLALFGLFLFLSIWETKARYVMHFIPVMMLITIDMLVKIKRRYVH